VVGRLWYACRSDARGRGNGIVFDAEFTSKRKAEGEMAMAKAYWVVRVSVRDEERYPEYLAAARPAFEKFGANFIVRGGAFETTEGTSRDRNVVVEFRDLATATACYRSQEYQTAKAIRQKYADADFIIIEGS
jgi:uncharacterized protein (DUF1330 family)